VDDSDIQLRHKFWTVNTDKDLFGVVINRVGLFGLLLLFQYSINFIFSIIKKGGKINTGYYCVFPLPFDRDIEGGIFEMASLQLPSSGTTLSISALEKLRMPTYSAEYLAEDTSYWPRVGIYLTCCVAVFFVLLRVYARVVLIKCFGLDDSLMMLAVVINLYFFPRHSHVVTRLHFPFSDMRRYRYAILQ
jgi:hypothetical protein